MKNRIVPMKNIVVALIAAGVLALIVMGALFSHPHQKSWQFIQSVGGMKVGKPRPNHEGIGRSYILPVKANLAGLETITTPPTVMNSSIVCEDVRAKVEDANIFLTVVAGSAGHSKSKTATCGSAFLPASTPPGEYVVYYRGPGEEPVKLAVISIDP